MNQSHKKPNIILITTDQQRFDTVGPMAPSFLRTPHMDHISREGVTFSSAYSDCPICVPARLSIMTGKYSFNHGMMSNGETSDVIGRDGTLPSYLRDLGYQTAAIGKMHFGPERARHGFDEMILPSDYYKMMSRQNTGFSPMHHGLGQNELYPTMATVPESMTLTSWTAEQCVDYIKDRRDPTQPFFLWCSFSKPHPPLDPPEPYYSMYRNSPIPEPIRADWSDSEDCPEAFKRWRQSWSLDLISPEVIREARAAYYGLVTQIDYNMGRVFAALQDLGMFEDTLIVFTSDHGEYLGDYNTGCKVFAHEASAHVPFILRMPKSWENRMHGERVETPVTHADILPTLVAAAGGNVQQDVDGLDLVALARQLPGKPQRCIQIQASTKSEKNSTDEFSYLCLTDGRWKYIWYPEGSSEQLFNLADDPYEKNNLVGIAEYEEKRQEFHDQLVSRHLNCEAIVKDGSLVARPLVGDSEKDRRNNAWPGYHTENYGVDVRH